MARVFVDDAVVATETCVGRYSVLRQSKKAIVTLAMDHIKKTEPALNTNTTEQFRTQATHYDTPTDCTKKQNYTSQTLRHSR